MANSPERGRHASKHLALGTLVPGNGAGILQASRAKTQGKLQPKA